MSSQVSIPLVQNRQYYRRLFDRVDTDRNGVINYRELANFLHLNNLEEPFPPPFIRNVLQQCDRNGDGQLDFDEFVAMIQNPRYKYIFNVKRWANSYVGFIAGAAPRRPQPQISGFGAALDEPDLEYEDEYAFCPPSLGMLIISLIEIAIFIADELIEENSSKYATGPLATILMYNPGKRYEAWRFLTYLFVHVGHFHLVVNMGIQLAVGIPLELVHGWVRVLGVYFLGSAAGCMAHSILDSRISLAGASGGVYALITAHVATIIMNWREMSMPLIKLAIFMIVLGIDLGYAIEKRFFENIPDHVGYVCHLGGAAAGLLVGIAILRNLKWTFKENVIWWISAILYVVLLTVGILWHLFNPSYFPAMK